MLMLVLDLVLIFLFIARRTLLPYGLFLVVWNFLWVAWVGSDGGIIIMDNGPFNGGTFFIAAMALWALFVFSTVMVAAIKGFSGGKVI